MRIIEIQPLDNGAHRNQTSSGTLLVPSGWAIIQDGMETPNFPFGDITVDNQYLYHDWIGKFDLIINSFEIKIKK